MTGNWCPSKQAMSIATTATRSNRATCAPARHFICHAATSGSICFIGPLADETISSIERRRRDPLAIRTVESVKGIGYGLHGDVHVNEALRVFASAMTYDYDTDVSGPAFLQRFPRLSLRISGATRDAAYFDNTLRAGASYDIAGCSLSAQFIRDQLLGTGEDANTMEVSAWIPAGNYWAFAPWLGQSSSDSEGDIVYGGLRISALW